MAHAYPRKNKNRLVLDRTSKYLLGAFVILAVITAIVAFIVIRDIVSSWSITSGPAGIALNDNSTNPSLPQNTGGVPISQPLQSSAGPTPQPWDGTSRVNMLIMGLDYADVIDRKDPRSDTMILLTLDPITKTAGMLSIPRDLWVAIPGFDYGKINTAYFLGEVNKMPGGGAGLAVKTVEQFLGVPINYYAQIDFVAFERFIDMIGGIVVDVPEDITVDPIGPGNTVTLKAGRNVLDGKTALAYARNRETAGGDVDRSHRQQQVILAMRDRVLKVNNLPVLISKAPQIYTELSAGIHTNMTLQQAVQLALLAQQVNKSDIHQAVIGYEEASPDTSPDGLSILKPFPDKIRLLRDSIFTTGGPVGPAAVAEDPQALMKAEAAKVQAQNGTQTPGLAGRTDEYLKSLGFTTIEPVNSDQLHRETTIIDYTGKPYTVGYLAKLMNVATNRIFSRYDPNAKVDVVVIVGDDWVANNSMP